MEGVEDIPGAALVEIQWEWESYPEYLDAWQSESAPSTLALKSPMERFGPT